MKMLSWRRHRLFVRAAIAASMLLLGSCSGLHDLVVVKKPPPRVTVKGYPLDLAFGAEPVAAAQAAQAILEALAPEFADEFVFPDFSFGGGASAPPDPCPEWGQDTIVEPIALDVTKAMPMGNYRMKQEGTIDIAGLFKAPLSGFSTRTFRNLTYGANGAFSFEVEGAVSLRRQIQRFEVRPNDGIYLTYIKTTANNVAREFNPILPVEIFPLPASANLPIGPSIGIDRVTGEILQVVGTIKGKERFGGCGEAYDAWLAETTWNFQRPGQSSVPWDYDYAFAPQLGGLMVMDHLAATEFFSTNPPLTISTDVTSTMASATPSTENL